ACGASSASSAAATAMASLMATTFAPTARRRTGDVARLLARAEADQLGPRGDVKLPEDFPQVVVDRPGTEEELRRDLAIRRALAHEAGDLQLLRCELVGRAGITFAGRLTARAELAPRPLLPRNGPETPEGLQGGAQMGARLQPSPRATKRFAVEQLGSRALERPLLSSVEPKRLQKVARRRIPRRELSPAPLEERERGRRARVLDPARERRHRRLGGVDPAC